MTVCFKLLTPPFFLVVLWELFMLQNDFYCYDIFCNSALIFCLFCDAPLWHRKLMLCLLQLLPPAPLSTHLLGTTTVNMHVHLSSLTSTCVSASLRCCHLLHKPVVSLSWRVSQMSFCKNVYLCAWDQFHRQPKLSVSIHHCACVRDTSLDVWCSTYTCWCVSLPTCQCVCWCSGSVCLCEAGFLWQMDWTRLDWTDLCTAEEWFRLLWPGSDRKPLSQVALGPTWYKY